MKRRLIIFLLAFNLSRIAAGQAGQPGDFEQFELTPVAPPTPALKYELLFSPWERLPGNGALLYAQADMMVNEGLVGSIDAAMDAYNSKSATFDSLSAFVENAWFSERFKIVELAARRERCDWELPSRELGDQMPLNHVKYGITTARLIQLRAIRQLRRDDLPGCLQTLRLGYEMGRMMGDGQFPINGEWGTDELSWMNVLLSQLMSRPNSPNLYWALASLPRPMISLRRCMEFDRMWLPADFAELAPDKVDDLTGDDWRRLIKDLYDSEVRYNVKIPDNHAWWTTDAGVADAVARVLPEAREKYAKSPNLSADWVVTIDPMKVVATYWYEQIRELEDDFQKVLSMPDPVRLRRIKEWDDRRTQQMNTDSLNPFLPWTGAASYRTAQKISRLDRQMAALTDVEAIRSYAAAHGGRLPSQLQDIVETPALDNPRTDRPFDYRVQDGTAILSDSKPEEFPLKYTIQIRVVVKFEIVFS